MKKITKLMLALALCIVGVGTNSVSAEIVTTKTPVILTGGKFAECFVPGTYAIQMQGWQSFVAYEDEEGVAFDENSTMVFNLDEAVTNGGVRVTFTFSDGTTYQAWWCLGIGSSPDDTNTAWNHDFDNSTYWLKKGLGDDFESKKSLKITKVTVDNFNTDDTFTYKVQGGTICGQPMTIKNANAKVFGAYGGEFRATAGLTNVFQFKPFVVSDYQKVVVKFAEAVSSIGNWTLNCNSGLIGLSGKTEVEVALDGTNINDFTIFNFDANPDPIKISEVYLYKEEAADVLLSFDEYGFATSDKKYLVAAGGLSYDPATGVLTSDGTAGTLTLEFTNSVNLEDLNTFNVKRTGNSDNIVNRLKFYDEAGDLINTWNNAKWSNSGLDYNATNAFKTHNPVKKLVWEADANAGNNGQTLTISGIEWQLKTISAMKGTDITTLPYKVWSNDGDNDATVTGDATPTLNIGVVTGNVVYGSDAIGNSNKYVDLTDCKKLIIRGYGNIRLFYNWVNSPENKPETNWNNNTTTVKTWELDIPAFMAEKGISHFHLVGVKTGWGQTLFVESISVVVGTENYDYAISGKGGLLLPSATEALADTKATVIDATGMTNDTRFKETLTTANPNCLIITDNADKLTNTQNVIAAGTCANLVLTDGHSFKAPADFTATSATYTTKIDTEAKAGTLILPFAATIPTGVKAYTLTYASGDAATATEQTGTIPASVPVLLNGSGEVTFTGSGTVTNVPTANIASNLVGVYEETTVPLGSYVLQYDEIDGVGFYKVTSGDIEANPFRAYLTAQGSGAKVRVIYEADDATAITSLEAQDVVNETIYNLNGMRISHPTKGIYIKNGKKFIVK